ncbi:cell surface glycoprotein CD200 receptor 1-like isoform X1 [Hippopotamus amphibius kiboko]|uniref:cell surface glycoprotein CD200 receptor 1-like isoform X1 n=1 Tax=Hippopotamus amphibius kiboko TaxID=575201 RepID=UPI002595003C|nr:cell surface glycoprotein CD200 receptor 1-like isoform X1 [Hippopotamus amphibius kiboko]
MQMFEKTSAERLLISIIMMSASTITSSSMDRHQRTITSPQEVNTSLLVLVDTKAMLSCPAVPWTSVLLATWEIVLRDKPPCLRAFRSDTNETTGGNCTDKRITWASGLDKNPALHIDPVAITHDGYYRCQIVIPAGNFHHGYHLQVLVPPEVTLVQTENGTAVCKAFAGKPAAQISWTPEGDCVTEQEPYWGNDTVTIQSTCRWDDRHVPNVSCSVSHLTGNRSLSIKLNQVLICRGETTLLLSLKRKIAQQKANNDAVQLFCAPLDSLGGAVIPSSCFLYPLEMLINVAVAGATTDTAFKLAHS